MASGFRVGATDLDNIFAPYQTGTKPAATGFEVGSQDLRDRYAPLATGQPAPVTGLVVDGVGDLNTLFASNGSASYALPCDDMTASVSELLTAGQSGTAYAQFVAQADGSYRLDGVRAPNGSSPVVTDTGTWHTQGGAASGYDVRYTLSNIQTPQGSQLTGTKNDASNWTALSADRVAWVRVDATQQAGTVKITADLKIELRKRSSGVVFSITHVHLSAAIEGSV